jgi:Lipocalin-like domain
MEGELKDKLIGCWSLLSFEFESADGNIQYPLGQDAEGSIFYSPDGYVAVNIMMKKRASFIDEALYAIRGLRFLDLPYLAYSGKYELDDLHSSVTHFVEIALYPEWIGVAQFRQIVWIGDHLQLSADNSASNGGQARLVWKKKVEQ